MKEIQNEGNTKKLFQNMFEKKKILSKFLNEVTLNKVGRRFQVYQRKS